MKLRTSVVLLAGGLVVPLVLGGCPPTMPGEMTGSCCAADGTCTVTTQAACTGTWTSGGTCSPNPCPPAVTPQLYVANFTGQAVLSFQNPATLNGNIAPTTNIAGAQTSLNFPNSLAVTANNQLLVMNAGALPPSIAVYSNAATANGNVVPVRNVQGAATGFSGPITLTLDKSRDILYVANNVAPFDINVFSGASAGGFQGNLPPSRTIKNGGLANPFGLSIAATDELYVANAGGNNILVFANASTANGVVAPSRTLTNAAFTGLFDCFIDSGDRLYIVTGSGGGANKNKVFVINSASTKNGPVTIDSALTVTGATALGTVMVDKNLRGYIIEGSGAGAIYSYDNINTRNGAFVPDRVIAGANTQLLGPARLTLVE